MTHALVGTPEIVGRTRELEAIVAALANTRSGRCEPAVVTVVGDPGIGKTRVIMTSNRLANYAATTSE